MNDNITSPFDNLRCFLCRKEFRNTTQLGIHDRRFHLEKGRNLYKCNNWDQRFKDKKVLGHHIAEPHIACSMCKKVFPYGIVLSYHIEPVHIEPVHESILLKKDLMVELEQKIS